MPLILASASPRRSELLRNAGIAFTVEPARVAEQALPDEQPLIYAQRLARGKALAVFRRRESRLDPEPDNEDGGEPLEKVLPHGQEEITVLGEKEFVGLEKGL